MNFTIAREQIQKGLQAVQNVVSSRTTVPILSNVLIRVEGDRAEFTATDLDVTVSCTVECKVGAPGATTLPVKKISGIASELAASEVEMDVDEKHQCSIQCGPSYFKVRGLAAEDFPPLPVVENEKKVVVPQEALKAMLRKTSFATSSDESRYVLNGIFFSLKENKVTMVATDGRRLAMVEQEAEIPERHQTDFIVPSKAIAELSRLLQDKGNAELAYTENHAIFTLTDEKGEKTFPVVVMTKLIEGNYPNYRQVIPAETRERVALNREELLHALCRAAIMTSDKQNSVKLTFSKNNLSVTANTPDVGEARDTVAINYKGKDLSIAFNPGYVIEPLRALAEDEVFLELIDELSPGVLKIQGPFLYVVMPMRLT